MSFTQSKKSTTTVGAEHATQPSRQNIRDHTGPDLELEKLSEPM